MTAMRPNNEQSVLIVDDDPIVRSLMCDTLEDAGYVVHEAGDGEDALKELARTAPDLLIVDAMMPGLDGFAVCRAVRAAAETRHLPILMATGLEDDASVANAYEAGATDFVAKPINWINLSQRVRYLLRAAAAFEELRASEASLLAAKTAAERAHQAKSEFLATMGHELRTPLNAIIGFADIIGSSQAAAADAAVAEYAAYISTSGAHLLSNVNDILEFARAEQGALKLSESVVDLAAVMAAAARAVGGIAREANIELRSSVEPGLPNFWGDRARLERVLVNLLSNAVKFSPAAGIVDLAVRSLANGGIEFAVSDNGIGMSAADIEVALAPFGQVDSNLGRKFEGAGIGLPLTSRLVALHGGELQIDSEPGRGAAVHVRFPPERCNEAGLEAGRARAG